MLYIYNNANNNNKMTTLLISYCEPNQIVIKYIGISMGMGTNSNTYAQTRTQTPNPNPNPIKLFNKFGTNLESLMDIIIKSNL